MSECSKLLFSRKEASQLLGLSVRTVDYLIASGALKPKRLGRKILIPKRELIRFTEQDHPTYKLVSKPVEIANLRRAAAPDALIAQSGASSDVSIMANEAGAHE
jgi:excisionase family DNA binding protein